MPHSSEGGALSYNQRALWFATQLDSTAYNLAYGFRLRGAVEPELLRRALALLVERHPVLRTTFTDTERRRGPPPLQRPCAPRRRRETPRHPELAWIPLAAEGVEVHVVPGNHVTMLREPHLQELARKVRGVLGERA
ncbi:condensation domain-containing protein [Archangium gephyra]|uniref:condensation domain-containing protein n=1 Tax=Archangium gephyra TaxID=48 RepID=UPI0035D4E266